MQWFRMYAEFLTDPVVRMLAFEDQRHFVAALCMKASGALDKEYSTPAIRRRALASLLGLSCETYDGKPVPFDEANRRLRELGLVDENWQPINWDKRQFQSDSAAERMRRWRERHRDVTVTSPLRTRTDTDTDTDTDTEQKKNKKGAPAPLVLPNGFAMKEWAEWIAHRKTRRWPCDPRTLQKQIDLLAKYGHAEQTEIIDRSINAGWQGLFPPKASPKSQPSTWMPPPDEETDVPNRP